MANCDTTPLTCLEHMYYIPHQARHPTSALIKERDKKSPMSRISLHRPRRNRAVWDRPATGTRLFPCPFPPNFPHYKRCPKAHRLRLRSDQSLFLTGPRDPPWKVPGQKPASPFPRANAKCALHSPGAPPSPSRAAPTSTASSCSPGPLCPETPPS